MGLAYTRLGIIILMLVSLKEIEKPHACNVLDIEHVKYTSYLILYQMYVIIHLFYDIASIMVLPLGNSWNFSMFTQPINMITVYVRLACIRSH